MEHSQYDDLVVLAFELVNHDIGCSGYYEFAGPLNPSDPPHAGHGVQRREPALYCVGNAVGRCWIAVTQSFDQIPKITPSGRRPADPAHRFDASRPRISRMTSS